MKEVNHDKQSRKVSHPTQLLTLEQVRQFLRAAKGDPLEAFYILALTTGMRWGDLLTLKWKDLDLTQGRPQVSGTIPQRGQGKLRVSEQKTKIGRCIVLTALASEALVRHHLRQDERRLAAGESWEDYGLIFCDAVGNPLDANNIRRHSFIPLRERASLAFMHFHDLRPSAVRLLLLAGAHPRVVQEMFGYRSSSTIAGVHISPSALMDLQEEAVQRLNVLLLDEQRPVGPALVDSDRVVERVPKLSPDCALVFADKDPLSVIEEEGL